MNIGYDHVMEAEIRTEYSKKPTAHQSFVPLSLKKKIIKNEV